MKIITYIWACALIWTGQPLLGSEGLDRNYINHLVANIRIIDRDYISRGDHGLTIEEVIDALRNVDRRRTDRVLIRLRDEATIQKYISLLRETEGRNNGVNSALALSYSPWVIPKLIEFLEVDEIVQQPIPRNVLYPGFSGTSAGTIRSILTRSAEFSDEVRRWSGDSLATGGIEGLREFRDELLIWWEENEEHFENEDYHLVRPVSRVAREDEEAPIEENDAPNGPADDAQSPNESAEEEARGEMGEEHAAISSGEDGSSDSSFGWLWVLCVILVGGAVVAGFVRSRSRKVGDANL